MKKLVFITLIALSALAVSATALAANQHCGTVSFNKWLPSGAATQGGFVLHTPNGQNLVFANDNANPLAAQSAQARIQYLTQSLGKQICVIGKILPVENGCYGDHNTIITDFILSRR